MPSYSDIMLNPVRIRIIKLLAVNKSMTATELCEQLSDVPRTTLYRHINVLLENNLLTIVSEKKIRGSVERTLALNIDEMAKNNTTENATAQLLPFLMNRYERFQTYFDNKNADPVRDRVFFATNILLASDEEYDRFIQELGQLMQRYSLEPAEGRRTRDLTFLSIPAESE